MLMAIRMINKMASRSHLFFFKRDSSIGMV